MSNARGSRVVVVGADAAGMSAAHQCLRGGRRRGRAHDVIVLEATQHTSYSACGIPYWIAGDFEGPDTMVARTADQHRAMGVDMRMGVRAHNLDLAARVVHGTCVETGERFTFPFDELVLATGARPVIPDWALHDGQALVDGVFPVKTLDDGHAWLQTLTGLQLAWSNGAASPEGSDQRRYAVVVGGGYIGIEMAEALVKRGFLTTLVTRGEVMASLDPDMGSRVREAMKAAGVRVIVNREVDGLRKSPHGWVTHVVAGDQTLRADVVALGLGATPRTELGAEAGLPLGTMGGYLPDDRQQLAEGVWAAGDCCESIGRVAGQRIFAPMGTHANKQGRAAGENLSGGDMRFGGVLGTAVTRFVAGGVHLEIGRTGPNTEQCRVAGSDVIGLVTEGKTASGYMPESRSMATKVLADAGTRKLLGLQIVGGEGSAKRIDTAVAALWAGMTVDDMAAMDLSYAPPFATVWEAVQLACRRLADRI